LLWAALVAGLAAGNKYNADWFCSRRFAKDGLEQRGAQHPNGILAILSRFVGFVLSTPYALLAPREFWGDGLRGGENGFAYELLVHPKIGSGEIFQKYRQRLDLPSHFQLPLS
jgi:hypothetical protein